MQLFCFTYAGGTASFFNNLECMLSKDIDVVKIDYPGHGTRRREKLVNNLDSLAMDMYEQLLKCYQGNEYCLLGYSMGGLVSIELYKRIIEKKEIPGPKRLFVFAHSTKPIVKIDETPSDELLIKRIVQFGGVPEKIENNKTFWRVYLPIYRSDFLSLSGFSLNKNTKINIPMTVFYSDEDKSYENIYDWSNYCLCEIDYHCYKGNHFFINNNYVDISKIINERIASI